MRTERETEKEEELLNYRYKWNTSLAGRKVEFRLYK